MLQIGRGWRVPATFKWLAFTLWHVSHSTTHLTISLFIRVHQKFCLRSWYILVLPWWMENLERCASSKIYFCSSWFFGTTRRSLNHKIPLWSTRKHLYLFSPSSTFCLIIPTLLSCNCAMMTWSWSVSSTEMWVSEPWGIISKFSAFQNTMTGCTSLLKGSCSEPCDYAHLRRHWPCLDGSEPPGHNL